MGGYQNYGPLLGPLTTGCRIILRTQKMAIILTTTHMPSIPKAPKYLNDIHFGASRTQIRPSLGYLEFRGIDALLRSYSLL